MAASPITATADVVVGAAGYESLEFRIPLDNGRTLFARQVKTKRTSRRSSPMSHQNHQRPSPRTFVLIVVHGGPGLSDHSESFQGLVKCLDLCQWDDGTGGVVMVDCVVFYDQLGCGQSDKPKNHNYSLEWYVDELRHVACHVSQRFPEQPICLLGHSWGGQIVLELILLLCCQETRASTIKDKEQAKKHRLLDMIQCAIISNSPLDETTYEQKQRADRAKLDPEIQTFLEQDEAAQAADGSVGSAIYAKLIGTSETNVTGEMKGWTVLNRLGQLDAQYLPCLFISGTYDTVPFEEYHTIVEQQEQHGSCSRGHQVVILEGADHGPFFGASADAYFAAISNFLCGLWLNYGSER